MDKKTYGALDESNHPNITYVLGNITDITVNEDGYAVAGSAKLTVAGQTRDLDLVVKAITGGGAIRFQGETEFDMNDFSVKPPSAMFVTIKSCKDGSIVCDVAGK